ncbi:hypothetical protein ASPNIDRAFT_42258 [Aspergillus niger ATCC 1015]|uniref:Zn(2)-C6 fungal-type domain-containing protein n=1 Tax=Aspergillus niger (strain ATCC 1015 / CBS 113.46 / FGSC A1144 / LSHB Ac4 / NCTC 3858a / NRRL 328 / USDA 3528.7) TaxID=380704 RepID=G3XVY3_ASPNA|nr:hypothetical protein ASPNIDRAFT_42258 [Aspergillus niger ATCC 1015]
MPRPKVRPEDRQRSSHACQTCKALKIRCDSQRPCSSCMRRGQSHTCAYTGMDRRKRKTCDAVQNTHSRAIDGRDGFSQTDSVTAGNDNTPFELDALVSEMVTPESRTDDPRPPETSLRERLSLGPEQSSKVDVGETSAMSFLHFLRKTVKAYVGSVPFTDAERHHIVIDTDCCSTIEADENIEPKRIHTWIDFYNEATSGILDLFTAHEVETLLAAHISSRQSASIAAVRREDVTAIGVALAIGAQVRVSDGDSEIANGYFRRARQAAFNDMLMGQNIGTVRLFLLMAFYMLGACHRNAASMFLGVAARAAIILELHTFEGYSSTLSNEDYESRRRIWHSMRNLDILSSFVLSRPRSLPLVPSMPDTNEEVNLQSAFYAVGNGCTLLNNIVDTLSKGGLLDVPTAEGLLSQLRKWSSGLPTGLRQFRSVSHSLPFLEPGDRQRLVGSIHVSCLYYFAVILVTRPYLIAYLTSRLRGKAPDHLISDPDEASDVAIKNNKVSKLAQVCTCVGGQNRQGSFFETFASSSMPPFTSTPIQALIPLSFSKFAAEPRRDIESLFNSSLHLLDDIGRTSPQAQLYHQILTSLNDAVAKFRNRVAGEVYRTVQDYMDQILMIDPNMDGDTIARSKDSEDSYPGWSDDWLAGAIRGVETGDIALDPVSNGTQGAQMFRDPGDWGDIDSMELGDHLLMDIEPFDQVFYTVE